MCATPRKLAHTKAQGAKQVSARRHLKGGLLLAGGGVGSAACSFARNIIIARLISVEDFGIAATFAMTMSLIEMASNLALDRLLVQAPDGDSPRMLATAHAFQVLRGAVSAILLFALAGPVAVLFDIPEVVWAFQIIALAPLIRSFMHLDVACQQREMRFGAWTWLDTAPQVLTALAAAPLALWLGDYRVMLAVLLGQQATMTLVSHVVAERPYRWAWDREIIGRMLRFGWPLLINGLLMFAIFQGDKAIIGAAFTMEDLGWYAVAFALALVPSTVVSKVIYMFFMPLLASVQKDPGRFQERATLCVQSCMLCGALVGIGFLLAGPSTLLLIYGERYAPGMAVVGILGVMQGLRIAKAGPAIVAMAKAETTNPLIANVVRCSGLIMALGAVALGYGVLAVAICGLIGEFLGALTAVYLLRVRLSLRIAPMLSCFASCTAVTALSAAVAWLFFDGNRPWIEAPVGATLAMGVAGLLSLAFPNVLSLLQRVRSDLADVTTRRNEPPGASAASGGAAK